MSEDTWRLLFLPILGLIGVVYLMADRWCQRHPDADADRVLAWTLGVVLAVTVGWVTVAQLWWPDPDEEPPPAATKPGPR